MNWIKKFPKNELGKDFVTGDIHGCFSKLREELANIHFNEYTDRLFSVGDLVDRGPESEEALDWLALPWFHAVCGNHEQMTIDLHKFGGSYYDRSNGMSWILDMPKERQKVYYEAFKDLPVAIEIAVGNKKYGIIHAEVPTDDWDKLESLLTGAKSESVRTTALWDRGRISYQDKSFVKNVELVYVGHTPLDDVTVMGNVIYIDTGACFENGKITVLEIY